MLGVLPSDKTMLGTLPSQTANTVGLQQQVPHPQPDFDFSVYCPHCQRALQVSSKYAGQQMLCSACSHAFKVPSPLRPSVAGQNVRANALPQCQGPQILDTDPVKQAILFILQEDARNAAAIQPGEKAKPSEVAAAYGQYCAVIEQLDLSQCPADFRVAYRHYIRAWRERQAAVAQFPDDFLSEVFVGFLNGLLNNESDGGRGRWQMNLRNATVKVQTMAEEVEKIGAKYGAAL